MKNGKPRGQYAVTTINKNAAPPEKLSFSSSSSRNEVYSPYYSLRPSSPTRTAKRSKTETRKSASGRKNNRRRGALGKTQNDKRSTKIIRRKKSENRKQRKHKNGVSGSGHPFSFPEKKKRTRGKRGKGGKRSDRLRPVVTGNGEGIWGDSSGV